jgi:hypothetical protein
MKIVLAIIAAFALTACADLDRFLPRDTQCELAKEIAESMANEGIPAADILAVLEEMSLVDCVVEVN